MARQGAPEASADPAVPGGRGVLRIFLMVAGGLAAPALALAAFFVSNSGSHTAPTRPPAVQAGLATGATGAGRSTSTGPRAPQAPITTTTTTTAPATPAGPPPRDPFLPLVTQGAPGGAPAH